MDKVLKAGLSDSIIKFAEFKSQKELKKGDGTKRSRLIGTREKTNGEWA